MYYVYNFFLGYKGTLCDDKIQGCGDGKNICRNGTCEPTNDSYTCKCFSGYIGSHCSIFNECDDAKCSYQGECRPSYDEYELTFIHECKCKDGYSGTDCGTEVSIIFLFLNCVHVQFITVSAHHFIRQ